MTGANQPIVHPATSSPTDYPLGIDVQYDCDLQAIPDDLARVFVRLELDREGEAFVVRSAERRYRRVTWLLKRALSWFWSDFDLNATFGWHRLFLLSVPQLLTLLRNRRTERWLDVGSGNGDITSQLAALSSGLTCIEVSRASVRRLRRRGFDAIAADLSEPAQTIDASKLKGTYDVVSAFNVLDRCARPRTLLRRLVAQLADGGCLMLSVPLPIDAFYFEGPFTRAPLEPLQVNQASFEAALTELWSKELAPLGLRPQALSRVPYFSSGDITCPLYGLDCAVIVCDKLAPSAHSKLSTTGS